METNTTNKEAILQVEACESIVVLAKWHNTLNSWKWPDDLNGTQGDFDKSAFKIMNLIFKKIGHKEILRELHINRLGRTNKQFETWWTEIFEKE